jgi:hypothetical protein
MPDTPPLHPSTAALLRFFQFDHLPSQLRTVSAPFAELAHRMVETLPPCPELTAGLRKLLEAKDCAVRSALDGPVRVVQGMARDQITQTLHLNVRVPDGMSAEAVASLVATEVQREMAQRSAAERSQR